MDHLLTDYAVQIRNRMQNQTGRALLQAKNNSLWKWILLLRSFSTGSIFMDYELIILNFSFKISLRMCTCRAYFRSFRSFVYVSAVTAFPAKRSVALKGLIVL
ncbi:Uncharacterised protein [Hungatella hathewayi]|uniref:Uncharacterized protein n=1 Tax=Hungatella hathewayi TaxID=154046 RepID=A0A174M5J5_9FIRM|nr:Uncharacterised protein [Hungatella hathewayi]